MTFLGSVPFLLRFVKDSSGRRRCDEDEGAACDDAVDEGDAADAAEAGDSSGLLGGETERPQPKRPRRKLEVAARFRPEEDWDDGTGLDSSLMTAAAAAATIFDSFVPRDVCTS